MTLLEHRLREELQDIAQRVDPASLRPLRPPRVRAGSLLARWLVPLAAATAVACVATALSLARPITGHGPSSLGWSAISASGMPRFYVRLDLSRGTSAVVADSATGLTLATVPVPGAGYNGLPQVAAAADDRTFAILTAAGPNRGLALFRLRVLGDGRSARLRQVPIKPFTIPLGVTGIALSPDGSELATTRQGLGAGRGALMVTSLATGATRIWLARAPGIPGQPAWTDHGTAVGFVWDPPFGSRSATAQVRVLDLARPGRDLLAARIIARLSTAGLGSVGLLGTALVTPDGSMIIAAEQYSTSPAAAVASSASTVRPLVTFTIMELSARTGRALRILRVVRARSGSSCAVLSLGPVGVHALVQCPQIGSLSGTRFSRLRGHPTLFLGNYAW